MPDGDKYITRLVAANIVYARELAGLSQRELAIRLEIDRRQLSEWERGVWKPGDRNLVRLADALGRTLAFFYTEHPAVEA